MTNDDNPYRFVATEASDPDASGETSATFHQPESGRKLNAFEIRRLAFAQRSLLVCTAVLIALSVVGMVAGNLPHNLAFEPSIELRWIVFLSAVCLLFVGLTGIVAAAFFIFVAGRLTHSTLIGFLLLIPVLVYAPLGLPIVAYLHFRANYILKRHGISVGWLGPSWRSLPPPNASPLPASASS